MTPPSSSSSLDWLVGVPPLGPVLLGLVPLLGLVLLRVRVLRVRVPLVPLEPVLRVRVQVPVS